MHEEKLNAHSQAKGTSKGSVNATQTQRKARPTSGYLPERQSNALASHCSKPGLRHVEEKTVQLS
jgi:hypothetical protein